VTDPVPGPSSMIHAFLSGRRLAMAEESRRELGATAPICRGRFHASAQKRTVAASRENGWRAISRCFVQRLGVQPPVARISRQRGWTNLVGTPPASQRNLDHISAASAALRRSAAIPSQVRPPGAWQLPSLV
jgi:hypothetical protein